MLLLYNISISFYRLGVYLASFINPKATKWIEGRKGLLCEIEQQTAGFDGETVWVHCASLGEFEMARPIIESVKARNPSTRIVVTFFSPSGYEVRKDYQLVDHVFYLPIDSKSNAESFIGAIKPTTVIFVKYDLWFHYLNEAKKAGAKLILISAQFRQKLHFFKLYGTIGRRTLRMFNRIFLVDEKSKKLLDSIAINDAVVCGDTRYDRVVEVAKASESVDVIERFKSHSKLVICGSTWAEDEALLVDCVKANQNVKWVIAPHEVGEENLKRMEKLFADTVRLSNFSNSSNAQVLLVDGVGYLSKLYRYADVAYVGGGFKTGLHNILEATAFGVPTIFGPCHSRFPDAGEMDENGLAFSIKNQEELGTRLSGLLSQDQTDLRNRILAFMEARTGATRTILQYLNVR
ncbi:MAG: glycosyltransferase N-terminal domain-containing protein [Flavobacteriales bacterium]|nr:glycosyltransferase N-terminal domain-containing protein [Flavobacteriales bacterium]